MNWSIHLWTFYFLFKFPGNTILHTSFNNSLFIDCNPMRSSMWLNHYSRVIILKPYLLFHQHHITSRIRYEVSTILLMWFTYLDNLNRSGEVELKTLKSCGDTIWHNLWLTLLLNVSNIYVESWDLRPSRFIIIVVCFHFISFFFIFSQNFLQPKIWRHFYFFVYLAYEHH